MRATLGLLEDAFVRVTRCENVLCAQSLLLNQSADESVSVVDPFTPSDHRKKNISEAAGCDYICNMSLSHAVEEGQSTELLH